MGQSIRFMFWLNLALFIATTYVIVWYLFAPTNNHCQMTFMMEPPQFLPVPIEDSDIDGKLNYPRVNIRGQQSSKTLNNNKQQYTLFLYSELGFPQATNMERDLKDSMPVLFIPGNAGSYQQVRSLASTCIRRQLQSLEAFKFAFYTIDFKDQLSALNAQLIINQTVFVRNALKQISRRHPAETGGVILIGHSVGGVIAKHLFTMPDFNASSVPLLISLAGPLTMPYINFDSEMRQLYSKTNQYWAEHRLKDLQTLSVSISGGQPDRLVPLHLSMDPQLDLSIATTSIRNVWLAADHVCISWCRELMLKLARLMSALMDKKQTRLINDRKEAMSIIKDELLIDELKLASERPKVIQKDWKSKRSHQIIKFDNFYTASRSQLRDNILIFDLTERAKEQDLFIQIEHIQWIEKFKGYGVFACQSLNASQGQIYCSEKIDLMYLAVPFPSRRFEPKKTNLKLFSNNNNDSNKYNHILIDFTEHAQSYSDNKTPESLIIQSINFSHDETHLYIPTLYEMILKRMLFINPFKYNIISTQSVPIIYRKFKILNLEQETQVFTIKYQASNCRNKAYDYQARGATILFRQGKYLSEIYYPKINDKMMSTDIKLDAQKTIMISSDNLQQNQHQEKNYLELYVDGECDHNLNIELDIFKLVVNAIQKRLNEILALATFLAYIQIVQAVLAPSIDENIKRNKTLIIILGKLVTQLLGSAILCINQNDLFKEPIDSVDKITSFLIIYLMAQGTLAFLDNIIKRVINFATIIYNLQSFLMNRITQHQQNTSDLASNSNGNGKNESNGKPKLTSEQQAKNDKNHSTSTLLDLDWVLLSCAIIGGLIFSNVIISIFILLIVIKYELKLQDSLKRIIIVADKGNTNCCGNINNKHCLDDTKDKNSYQTETRIRYHEYVFELLVSIMVLCSFALISNIPTALIRYNNSSNGLFSTNLIELILKDASFLSSIMTLYTIRCLCWKLEADFRNLDNKTDHPLIKNQSKFSKLGQASTILRYICLLLPAFLMMFVIDFEVHYINNIFNFATIQWIFFHPPNYPPKSIKSETTGTKESRKTV